MSRRRSILIADPDAEVASSIKEALRDQYEIIAARDGSKALELAILNHPDLILFYRSCPLIGATQFLRILRSNPRTEDIPLIVLSDEPVVAGAMPGFLEGVLVKPLNMDEVSAHLAQVFRRSDAVREVGHEAGSVSGSLEQISMVDLLQVFSMNRRSGALQIVGPAKQTAEVFVYEGRVEEAMTGSARGAKALYRLLGWTEGRFSFVPGRRAPSVSISGTTDSLMIEGMRQNDELERIRVELPAPSATLERLVTAEDTPPGLHPVNVEILELVQHYPRVADLVDRTQASDFETYLALRSLIQAALVRVVASDATAAAARLLTQDEIFDLRSRLRRSGLSPTYTNAPKLAFVAADPLELKRVRAVMSRWGEFQADGVEQVEALGFGSFGALALDHGLSVDLYAVSAEDRMLPLGYAMSAGTVAAVVLGAAHLAALATPLRLLEQERRATLLFARRHGEPAVEASKTRVVLEVSDLDGEELRRVVQAALRQVGGTDLRGVSL